MKDKYELKRDEIELTVGLRLRMLELHHRHRHFVDWSSVILSPLTHLPNLWVVLYRFVILDCLTSHLS